MMTTSSLARACAACLSFSDFLFFEKWNVLILAQVIACRAAEAQKVNPRMHVSSVSAMYEFRGGRGTMNSAEMFAGWTLKQLLANALKAEQIDSRSSERVGTAGQACTAV